MSSAIEASTRVLLTRSECGRRPRPRGDRDGVDVGDDDVLEHVAPGGDRGERGPDAAGADDEHSHGPRVVRQSARRLRGGRSAG